MGTQAFNNEFEVYKFKQKSYPDICLDIFADHDDFNGLWANALERNVLYAAKNEFIKHIVRDMLITIPSSRPAARNIVRTVETARESYTSLGTCLFNR